MDTHQYGRGHFKKYLHFIFYKIFIYVTAMRTLLFNIISLLLDTFSPAICKLLNAVGKESLWLRAKPVMHRLFHLIISRKLTTSNGEAIQNATLCSLHQVATLAAICMTHVTCTRWWRRLGCPGKVTTVTMRFVTICKFLSPQPLPHNGSLITLSVQTFTPYGHKPPAKPTNNVSKCSATMYIPSSCEFNPHKSWNYTLLSCS